MKAKRCDSTYRLRRNFLLRLAVSCIVALSTITSPAWAVTGGVVDENNDHPGVGAIVTVFGDEAFVYCSGSLIHPHVLLTAGHCAETLESLIEDGFITTGNIRVSFAQQALDPNTWLEVESVVRHPDFVRGPLDGNRGDSRDVGMIILKEPVLDVEPIQLPLLGMLDELKRNKSLHKSELLLVGYGATLEFPGPELVFPDGLRRFSLPDYRGLSRAWITIGLMEQGGEVEGGCFGDSGAPLFWVAPDGTRVLAGIVSWGNHSCVGAGHVYRADIPQALDFIGSVLDLVDAGLL